MTKVRVPIITPVDIHNFYEHPPMSPYKGEYPRFLRKPGVNQKHLLEEGKGWRWETIKGKTDV